MMKVIDICISFDLCKSCEDQQNLDSIVKLFAILNNMATSHLPPVPFYKRKLGTDVGLSSGDFGDACKNFLQCCL